MDDFLLHPEGYRSIRAADLAKYVWQYERALQQNPGQIPETLKVAERVIFTGIDIFCRDQRQQLKGDLPQKLAAITAWDQYAGNLAYEKMIWALLRNPNPHADKLAILINNHRQYPERGWDAFLDELCALPEFGREEARREVRNHQRNVRRLEGIVADQQKTLIEFETKATEHAPPAPVPQTQPGNGKKDYGHIIEDKNRQLRELREEYGRVMREIDTLRHEPIEPTGPSLGAFSFTDYHALVSYYRGRRVLSIGGFKGSPMAATRSYHVFLANQLNANLEVISADLRSQQLQDKLRGCTTEEVVLHLTYCSSHAITDCLQKIQPPNLIRFGIGKYDENAFVTALLVPVKQRQREQALP